MYVVIDPLKNCQENKLTYKMYLIYIYLLSIQ